MKKIALTGNRGKGLFVLIDDKDYEWISKLRWYLNENGYPRTTRRINRKYMHQLILPNAKTIDHIDGDKLNNQRDNLRICTQTQNCYNQKLHKNNTSGYRGVTWDKRQNQWIAQIMVNRKAIYLGSFTDLRAAILARKWGEKLYFKEFSHFVV